MVEKIQDLAPMRNVIIAGTVSLWLLGCGGWSAALAADTADETKAAVAWNEVQQSTQLPKAPAEWNDKAPTEEQEQEFYKKVCAAAESATAKAKAFCASYPDSTNVVKAKQIVCQMLEADYRAGGAQPEVFKALRAAQDDLVTDSHLTEKERYKLRESILFAKRTDPSQDWKTKDEEYEKGVQALIKDFPDMEDPYVLLVNLAANSADTNKAHAMAEDALAHCQGTNVQAVAKGVLLRLDSVGKPVEIQFTALDGRKVDLSAMKGKVVLVDFWATWCGPCVGEMPHVKEAYEKYHDKGFEVVGISFDSNQQALERFVRKNEMPWPQYFDGKGWDNQFGIHFAIRGIPAMWLIDKEGNLQTTNARQDLQDKVKALLAEGN